jgi:hypothetical protein
MKPYSELTGIQKAVEFLRWGFVPCAAGLVVIATLFIALFLIPVEVGRSSGFQRYSPWIVTILWGAGLVIAGAKAAPRGRIATAVVVALLWTFLLFKENVLEHHGQDTPAYTKFLVAMMAAASGVAYIAYSEKLKSTPLMTPTTPSRPLLEPDELDDLEA